MLYSKVNSFSVTGLILMGSIALLTLPAMAAPTEDNLIELLEQRPGLAQVIPGQLLWDLESRAFAGVTLKVRNSREPEANPLARGALFFSEADDSTKKATRKTILFLGNSLTAGFGLEPTQAFPALIQSKIDSLGWRFEVVNAGLSGETSSGGARRIDWLLKRRIDILVIELGANDALRGISLDVTKKNLQAIIDNARGKYPGIKIVLAGMQAPPNLGPDYTREFRAIFPGLAKQNEAGLIPFLLEGVGGVPELNLPDRIHPTAEGHAIVAENVWKILKPVLEAK